MRSCVATRRVGARTRASFVRAGRLPPLLPPRRPAFAARRRARAVPICAELRAATAAPAPSSPYAAPRSATAYSPARRPTAVAQWNPVVDLVAGAGAGGLAGRRAWIGAPEFTFGLLAALDAAAGVALAGGAPGPTGTGVPGRRSPYRRGRPRTLRARPPDSEARRERRAESASGLPPSPQPPPRRAHGLDTLVYLGKLVPALLAD